MKNNKQFGTLRKLSKKEHKCTLLAIDNVQFYTTVGFRRPEVPTARYPGQKSVVSGAKTRPYKQTNI